MPNVNSVSKYEVVGERKDDDLPCSECDSVGPIVIVKVGECTRDVCYGCVKKLGIEW
jgi:hypothetical protein